MAKKFFYACAGIFLIVLSYHVGALRAEAQAGRSKSDGMVDAVKVTARELNIVDQQGRTRIQLGAVEGVAYIMLRDESGVARAVVSDGADGEPMIAMSDANGTPRVAIAGSMAPTITLADANRSPRLQLALSGESSALTLMDANQTMRVGVSLASDGKGNTSGLVATFDQSGNLVWHSQR